MENPQQVKQTHKLNIKRFVAVVEQVQVELFSKYISNVQLNCDHQTTQFMQNTT
jgi:hypothetical protein